MQNKVDSRAENAGCTNERKNKTGNAVQIAHFDKNKFDYKLIKHEKLYAIVNKNHKLANHDFIDFLDLKNDLMIGYFVLS